MLSCDPDESVRARDIPLGDAMLFRPQPTESSTQSAGARSHGPSDFFCQFFLVEKPNTRNAVTGNLPTFQTCS